MRYTSKQAGLKYLPSIMGGVVALSLLQVTGANLLTNGGFEAEVVTDGGILYAAGETFTGWTANGNVSVYNTFSGITVMGGDQTLFITAPGSGISQDASVMAGVQYSLTWEAGNLADGVIYDYTVTLAGPALNAPIVQLFNSDNNGVASPVARGLNFTADNDGSVKVTFTRLAGGANFVALDNVVLTPEPQTYALAAGLGLMAFAGYRRFRR